MANIWDVFERILGGVRICLGVNWNMFGTSLGGILEVQCSFSRYLRNSLRVDQFFEIFTSVSLKEVV